MTGYLQKKIDCLTDDQFELYNKMQNDDLLQICLPTGAGKGFLMMADLLNQIDTTNNYIFAIATHRLMLNTQHLNDIFEMLQPYIGEIGYIFVGSSRYDVNKFQDNINLNNILNNNNLSYHELISSTTNMREATRLCGEHISKGRKVVILSTYHSLNKLKLLNVDTLYCDEAHTLASEDIESIFKDNFNKIKSKRCYFFTATPKDCVEETEAFLMNNNSIFGERVGLNFRHCIEKGYIVKPVVHIAMPGNYNEDENFNSVENMTRFIKETFSAHRKFIRKNSSDYSKIRPKILVKCASVDSMWNIHAKLVGQIPNVKVCAGASRNSYSEYKHFIDHTGITQRSKYLEELQKLKDDEMAIILHYDTMSEGINVAGFTGVEFLGGKLPTITKTLQNTGRATRLHRLDRKRLNEGKIKVGEEGWVKPYCSVIIPYYDKESEFTSRELARQIKSLRDNYGYDPNFYISIGDDIGAGYNDPEMDILNGSEIKEKLFTIIDEIKNEIEILDRINYSTKQVNDISELNDFDFLNYIRNGMYT